MSQWLIFGANGYTGKLLAETAVANGHRPVIAGRHPQKVADAALALGLAARVFDLNDQDRAVHQLKDIDVVVHCAGPFIHTYKAMLDACIASRTHYLDVTGEIEVFEGIHQRSSEIADAGICAIPGVGFDVVPTDCLAAMLKQSLPDATSLQLAFKPVGGRVSPGTSKTSVESMWKGGRVRKDGKIIKVKTAYKQQLIPFGDKPSLGVTIPWGDVSTAYYTTGIPNIEVYLGLPKRQITGIKASRAFSWLLTFPGILGMVKSRIERKVRGPTEEQRQRSRVYLWGLAKNRAGKTVEARMETPDGYALTADAALRAVQAVMAKPLKGALTPASAFGADFVKELKGVVIEANI